MKVSREQAADNRERVIEVAARLFRERGFDGIGVADLMKAAGLTHGGFYSQFNSKEDLAAEACARALGQTATKWRRLAGGNEDAFAAIVSSYLSAGHIDNPGRGCAFVALAAEAARHEPAVRRSFADGLRALIEILSQTLPDRAKAARRKKALAAMATLVGALVLARSVDDRKLAEEILQSAKTSL